MCRLSLIKWNTVKKRVKKDRVKKDRVSINNGIKKYIILK